MTHLLKPEEVAERLAVTPKVVRAWLLAGKIPGIRLGRLWRVHPDALDKIIKEGFPRHAKRSLRKSSSRSPSRSTRKDAKRSQTRSRTASSRKKK